MSENTKIEWADHTFNGWEGCQKVGPGCDHCYAETRNARFNSGTAINWGVGAPRRRTSVNNWNKPLLWNAKAEAFAKANGGRRQRVFCSSLSDVFDNEVPDAWRQDLFDLILATPNLDWLLLTKRIGNAFKMLNNVAVTRNQLLDANDQYRPPENVWIGATIVNQTEADRDIPKLLKVPAAKHFLSMEPLLGPVDLSKYWLTALLSEYPFKILPHHDRTTVLEMLDWVIVGGESGTGARPMHPDWVRNLRDQCHAAGTDFFFKQWGDWSPGHQAPHLSDAFAATKQFQFIEHEGCSVGTFLAGKKNAGRLLDGREWNEVPA